MQKREEEGKKNVKFLEVEQLREKGIRDRGSSKAIISDPFQAIARFVGGGSWGWCVGLKRGARAPACVHVCVRVDRG
jgi:hypothetical protein